MKKIYLLFFASIFTFIILGGKVVNAEVQSTTTPLTIGLESIATTTVPILFGTTTEATSTAASTLPTRRTLATISIEEFNVPNATKPFFTLRVQSGTTSAAVTLTPEIMLALRGLQNQLVSLLTGLIHAQYGFNAPQLNFGNSLNVDLPNTGGQNISTTTPPANLNMQSLFNDIPRRGNSTNKGVFFNQPATTTPR